MAHSGKITHDIRGYLKDILQADAAQWIKKAEDQGIVFVQRYYRRWVEAEAVSPEELKQLKRRPDFWEQRLSERSNEIWRSEDSRRVKSYYGTQPIGMNQN